MWKLYFSHLNAKPQGPALILSQNSMVLASVVLLQYTRRLMARQITTLTTTYCNNSFIHSYCNHSWIFAMHLQHSAKKWQVTLRNHGTWWISCEMGMRAPVVDIAGPQQPDCFISSTLRSLDYINIHIISLLLRGRIFTIQLTVLITIFRTNETEITINVIIKE